MISTTNNFITAVAQHSRQFRARFLVSGSTLDCDIKSVKCYKGSCSDNLSIGCVYASYIDVVLARCGTNLDGVKLTYQVGLYTGSSYEYITVGTFTVLDAVEAHGSVSFTAVSTLGMMGNDAYTTSLTYPATINQIIGEFSETIQLIGFVGTGSVQYPITGTKRDVLGTIAGLLGGFVTEDNAGNIVIAKYNSGGTANISPYRSLSIPEFRETPYYVAGIQITVPATISEEEEEEEEEPEDTVYTAGDPVIFQTNPWMTQALFNTMVSNFVGLSFDLATVDISLGDPRIEPWDKLVVTDLQGGTHTVPCFEIIHTFDGGLATEVIADVDSSDMSSVNVKGALQKYVERMDSDIVAAKIAADSAQGAAESAIASATEANTYAEQALTEAGKASEYAEEAGEYANDALASANTAEELAGDANTAAQNAIRSADAALQNLGIVEDVVNVLEWISTHGYYAPCTETEIVENKVYYTVVATAVANPDGNPSHNGYYELDNGKYLITEDDTVVSGKTYYTLQATQVAEPAGNPSQNSYYQLVLREAVAQYVNTHLSLTDDGLWVTNDNESEYRMLVSADSIQIRNKNNDAVATYGDAITLGIGNTVTTIDNEKMDCDKIVFTELYPKGTGLVLIARSNGHFSIKAVE